MAKRMKFSDEIRDYFQMTTQFERKSRKFATTSTVYNVEIMPFPENMIEEPLTFCQELFDRIVDELKERSDVKADDMIRVTVGAPPGVLGIWGEGLFIFRELGSTANYFRGAREQAHTFGDLGSTAKK